MSIVCDVCGHGHPFETTRASEVCVCVCVWGGTLVDERHHDPDVELQRGRWRGGRRRAIGCGCGGGGGSGGGEDPALRPDGKLRLHVIGGDPAAKLDIATMAGAKVRVGVSGDGGGSDGGGGVGVLRGDESDQPAGRVCRDGVDAVAADLHAAEIAEPCMEQAKAGIAGCSKVDVGSSELYNVSMPETIDS